MNAKEIQEIRFSKSMSGYKSDEVDDFCDKVYSDYLKFAEVVKTQQETIARLEEKLRETEDSAGSINTVLISAQKLADTIVADANAKAAETVENANNEAENIKQRTKKALEEIDAVITEQKKIAEKEAEDILKEAARKSEGMILAAKDSVAREQLLFDKLRSEVASFKREIKDAY
ncbi:MAG: DivIVA domain-containing protein, partial [Clostridia bacterium]|nr:DivIVA domain-containing protein [Clostridia bacterium]